MHQIAVLTPPNPGHIALVPTAFLSAATGTEMPNDANRSIGQTDHVGIARDAPNVAAGVVVCNHAVVVEARTIISQINRNSDNHYQFKG